MECNYLPGTLQGAGNPSENHRQKSFAIVSHISYVWSLIMSKINYIQTHTYIYTYTHTYNNTCIIKYREEKSREEGLSSVEELNKMLSGEGFTKECLFELGPGETRWESQYAANWRDSTQTKEQVQMPWGGSVPAMSAEGKGDSETGRE